MTDEPEEGPDPNDIRRHAKRLFTETQYRQKYRRIDFYKPNRKQLEFHNTVARERLLKAGNQVGKTHGGGAQMTFDLLSLYPGWYTGRRFVMPPKIERPYEFVGWGGCTTQAQTRNGIQTKLFGPVRDQGGLGSGLIPLDNIGRLLMARGVADFVDTVHLKRETGGEAIFRLKTFDQGREGWQGESVDESWIDEDPRDDLIYSECLARLTATGGQIIVSMTPLLGLSPVRKRFRERHEGTAEVAMGIIDCLVSNGGHIPDERLPELAAQYNDAERETRLNGADMQGEGAVFTFPIESIKHTKDPADIPDYWPWMWALDFSHSGMSEKGHPFAAVLGTWDRDMDVIYITHAVRMRKSLPPNHVAAMKACPMWEAPVAWPHDGGRASGIMDGATISATYKKLGLNMLPKNAAFEQGGIHFEDGIKEMENRFGAGRLKIAAHLTEIFDEYLGYHRINGLVHKVDDDLLSAIRVMCMDIRHAKKFSNFGGFAARRGYGSGFALGTPSHPAGDMDVFTGT